MSFYDFFYKHEPITIIEIIMISVFIIVLITTNNAMMSFALMIISIGLSMIFLKIKKRFQNAKNKAID
jgi:ABC-type bacteriocin/lantibiotic exporter with double-glycine peptidase domain